MKTDKIKPTIYLDMDGVLTDFVGATAKLFNFEGDIYSQWIHLLDKYNVKDKYSIEGVLSITTDNLWSTIDRAGITFWSRMAYYNWAFILYEELEKYGDVIILTSPSLSVNSWAGKVQSIQTEFGHRFEDFILCPSLLKSKLANINSILIDDSEANISAFTKAGGKAILLPQPWNSAYDRTLEVGVVDIIKIDIEILLNKKLDRPNILTSNSVYKDEFMEECFTQEEHETIEDMTCILRKRSMTTFNIE